jgi:hypothetical protein
MIEKFQHLNRKENVKSNHISKFEFSGSNISIKYLSKTIALSSATLLSGVIPRILYEYKLCELKSESIINKV